MPKKRFKISDEDDGSYLEIPDDAIISINEGPRVTREDLLQPSHPDFKRVYPEAWARLQEAQADERQEKREAENSKAERAHRLKKKLTIAKNRETWARVTNNRPDLKEDVHD